MSSKTCVQDDGSKGLCCRDVTNSNKGSKAILPDVTVALDERTVDLGGVSNDIVFRASTFGEQFSRNVTTRSGRAGGVTRPGTAEYAHFRFSRQSPGVERLGRFAVGSMFVAKTLRDGLSKSSYYFF